MKKVLLLTILLTTVFGFSLIDGPSQAVMACCENGSGDPGTCANGITPTRNICFANMAACLAGCQ